MYLLFRADPGLINHPVLDAAYYHSWAIDLTQGVGLARRVFWMSPTYPHVVALLYAVFGASPAYVGVAQAFMGASSCVMMFALGSAFFGPRPGRVAAWLLVFYRPLIYDSALLETVEITVFLLLSSLVLAVYAEGRFRWVLWVGSGALFALGCLARGNLILCIPALLVAPGGLDLRARIRAAVPIAVGLALVFLGVGLRNYQIDGEWLMTNTSSGPTFYLSHHSEVTTGLQTPPPFLRPDPRFEEADYTIEAERLTGRRMKPGEVSDFWKAKGMEAIQREPGRTFWAVVSKVMLTFGAREIPDNYSFLYISDQTIFGSLPLVGFMGIVGLGLVGVFLGLPQLGSALPLFALILIYPASLALFYTSSRLRMPLAPLLILFAGLTIVRAWEAVQARDLRSSVRLIGFPIILSLLSYQASAHLTADRELAQAYNSMGLVAFERRELDLAVARLRRAAELTPEDAGTATNLGRALLATQRTAEAQEVCRDATRLDPRLAPAYLCLALTQLAAKDLAGAEATLRTAVNLPGSEEAAFRLGGILLDSGRKPEARQLFEALLRRNPRFEEAELGLAMSLMDTDPNTARTRLQRLHGRTANAFTRCRIERILGTAGLPSCQSQK